MTRARSDQLTCRKDHLFLFAMLWRNLKGIIPAHQLIFFSQTYEVLGFVIDFEIKNITDIHFDQNQ